jgi:L-erythro-3,5-diaminohexanoate dehydrogenase
VRTEISDPVGLHRVLEPPGALPQAALRLDARPEIWPDEVRLRVERLNLDAASFRQLRGQYADPARLRAAVLAIVAERGKLQNPVTGSGGMLIGIVEEVGPASPLGLQVGDQVATLVSLSLTPLVITDGLARWDGVGEQVPADGHAILFARSVAARLPDDVAPALALAVMDVCGAPALTARVVERYVGQGRPPAVVVVGGAGKSGSLSLAAARRCGAATTVGIVPHPGEADLLQHAAIADEVRVADARDAVSLRDAVHEVLPGGADLTVVCVDVPGCEGAAVLATRDGGTVLFFSMATSFTAAALGAEGLGADVTMLIGNGYVPGHADLAMTILRQDAGVRSLFGRRV